MSNKYKVPARQWRKWFASERDIFNYIYSTAKSLDEDLVTAWNCAWLAADYLRSKRKSSE